MRLNTRQKNYRYFVDQAETAFSANKFLEAFLIQSCIIESVLKEYAFTRLASDLDRSASLKNKFKNFEFARLIDELFLTSNINKELYENLSKYRKKRNGIVHNILKHDDKIILNKELRETYELGKHMKGFIVDEMIKSQKGKTFAELAAKQEAFISAFNMELPKVAEREIGPMIRKLYRDLGKIANKKGL